VVALTVLALATAQMVFPGKTWTRKSPADAGFNPAKFQAALDYPGRNKESFCAAITRNGYLIGDKYWGPNGGYNKTNILWSVSKAWIATLIGVAQRDGKLHVNDSAAKTIKEWAATAAKDVPIDTILRHCSGRHYDEISDYVTPQSLTDQTTYAIKEKQDVPPATKDQYNNMAYQVLQAVFERATGVQIQTASQREFYGPMQFESNTFWQMRSFFLNVPQKYPLVYGGVTTSCVDLARFGLLWLNQGKWGNHTVFKKDFFDQAMATPVFKFGQARRYGNWGTGADIRSMGFGKQVVMFNPVTKVVVSRTGETTSLVFDYNDWFKMITAALTQEEKGNDSDWMMAGSIDE